eukprot:CAMPEP_0118960708 /NCGR_PEP_ID=MMETSP1169-20130426/63775_1 /TAXON_ID=36882 /ORGANISM="Pyramimonas obovata, Strain CCMP722" /LENGTH=366 /DNA_ID=CAMNT_0006908859 /DNA_START=664 /DNA_END=1762 /DNA_ORIENTATION=+
MGIRILAHDGDVRALADRTFRDDRDAADAFFAPAVGIISDRLRLPPDVAGATLLAFGNGAPDFFTQIAAITHSATVDLPLALGESVGAAIFVCTFCMGLVILVSPKQIVVASGPFTRDALAYLVALTLTSEAIVDSNFEPHESLFLVLWYLCYLTSVFYGGRLFPTFFDSRHAEATGDQPGNSQKMKVLPLTKKDSNIALADDEKATLTTHDDSAALDDDAGEVEAPNSRVWLAKQADFGSMGLLGKLGAPVNLPILSMQAVTMPPMGVKVVDRAHVVLMCAVGPSFFHLVFLADKQGADWAGLAFAAAVGAASGAAAYWRVPVEGLQPRTSLFLCSIAFVQGVAWMNLCADEIVAIFQTIGRIGG